HIAEVAREPELHRAVAVFVLLADRELALVQGLECGPKRASHRGALTRADDSTGGERLDVAQRADDVPPEQPRVDLAVVSHGVSQHCVVRSDTGRPQCLGSSAPHARYLSAIRAYSARAAITSGMSTDSSGVCDRRDVPGPTLIASTPAR